MVKPINSWSEFKKTLRELNDPEVKELFKTVIIDTADIAYSYCEKAICSQESNEKLLMKQSVISPMVKDTSSLCKSLMNVFVRLFRWITVLL